MALADELKTLQELHEKGQLSDQEYADAKAALIRGQSPNHTQAHKVAFGRQVQKKKSLGTINTLTIVIGGFFILMMILNYIYPKARGGNGGSSPPSIVQRPAVLVMFDAVPSGDPVEDLGAKDYLDATMRKNLSGAVAGLNALCSEFHFYSDVSQPDHTMIFGFRDIDQIGVVLADKNGSVTESKHATSVQNAYFAACGLLRAHASDPSTP